MWAVESQRAGQPGLYQWRDGALAACRSSRLVAGGLVGDLLCLGALDDAAIDTCRRVVPVGKDESGWPRRVRDKVATQEQRKLRELRRKIASVAAPIASHELVIEGEHAPAAPR